MVDQHQFGRAAADVEDQRRAAAGLEQFVAAEHGEPRFLLGRDDFEHHAGLAADAVGEVAAVARAAARLGRDRARQGDVAAAQFVGADGERGDRAVHRRVAQHPARAEPLAEPDDARESVDDGEPALARAGDQQAAIVGAKVERAIGAAHAIAALERRWRWPVGGWKRPPTAKWRPVAPCPVTPILSFIARTSARATDLGPV